MVKCGRENRTLQPSPSLGRRSRVVVVLADPIRELVVLLPLQGIGVGVRAGDDGAAARVREAQVLHGLASGSCCDRTACSILDVELGLVRETRGPHAVGLLPLGPVGVGPALLGQPALPGVVWVHDRGADGDRSEGGSCQAQDQGDLRDAKTHFRLGRCRDPPP